MTTLEHLYAARKNINKAIEEAEKEKTPVTDISVKWEDGGIRVNFKTDIDIDIHYWFDEKIHSVVKYTGDINEEKGTFLIGIGKPNENWNVQLVGMDTSYISEKYNIGAYKENPGNVDNPQTGELIAIHEINKSGDPLSNIAGVVERDGKVQVYVNQRNGRSPLIFESDDMEKWTNEGESDLPSRVGLFKGSNGRLHGWKAEGNGLDLLLGSNLHNDLGRAYDWKIDGAVCMHEAPGGYFRAFGRVRGNTQPKNEGGWGNDLPEFPKGNFQDRRGISYHMGSKWQKNWEKNRILADPADYFNGYHRADVDSVPDFYSSFFLPDGRGFVNVFWKSKSRKVDRWHLEPGVKESRRYRLTGEIFPVPAIYDNGKIELFPEKIVIHRHLHEREPLPDIPYTGPEGKKEIGEIYVGGIVHRNGHVYIFYKWRGGLHYEGHDRYPSGIYAYRLSESGFDALFN